LILIKEYECKVLAGDETYIVLGANIADAFVYHSELLSEHYQEIPEEYSAEEVIALMVSYNQTT
jgi:hypothetical protein